MREEILAPTRPVIEAKKGPEGSVCFTEEDAQKLFLYILELEKRSE